MSDIETNTFANQSSHKMYLLEQNDKISNSLSQRGEGTGNSTPSQENESDLSHVIMTHDVTYNYSKVIKI